ncbi:hypothetical protein ADL22_18990 [Streptomyces sp. NRRL F-4489]|uniref:hypothetical protein n=1 Tax=Streptomyces sp. NRRL F-4489 TaxID=1609095 RepID=UPI00074AF5DC|nr:hypothetical protein [Streptomyces sp. NRRL F-4489]KUL38194.1 hypothetical protein ADL22_18990 [Streptomyces sp. NRRL F-4489]
MSERHGFLGPLGQVDGHWVVGNYPHPGRAWLTFRKDGIYQHTRKAEEQLIPWSRFMLFNRFTLGAKYPSKGQYGVRALFFGGARGYLHVTLRHPYEDWLLTFDGHPHRYTLTDMLLFEALLASTINDGEAHRLGDGDWLRRAVEHLTRERPRTTHRIRKAVKEAREL